jgi:hypothetical protein
MILIPGAMLGGIAIVAAPLLIVSLITGQPIGSTWEAKQRLCDRAVEALLHSSDLIEVKRAGIIIHEVDCAIGRRLPQNQE